MLVCDNILRRPKKDIPQIYLASHHMQHSGFLALPSVVDLQISMDACACCDHEMAVPASCARFDGLNINLVRHSTDCCCCFCNSIAGHSKSVIWYAFPKSVSCPGELLKSWKGFSRVRRVYQLMCNSELSKSSHHEDGGSSNGSPDPSHVRVMGLRPLMTDQPSSDHSIGARKVSLPKLDNNSPAAPYGCTLRSTATTYPLCLRPCPYVPDLRVVVIENEWVNRPLWSYLPRTQKTSR